MTIPSPPTPVKLSQVITEFGPYGSPSGTASCAAKDMGSYHRGGAYVVCGLPGTGNIPTSNPLPLSSFAGESNTFVTLTSTHTSGSGSETVPPGAEHVIIDVWGGGASGYHGYGTLQSGTQTGSGGGSGGLSRSIINLPKPYSSYWGRTINYSVGAGGSGVAGCAGGCSTVSSGTFSVPTIIGGGAASHFQSCGGTGGTGTYSNGNPGANNFSGPGSQGIAITGPDGGAYGSGGEGGCKGCSPGCTVPATPGSPGAVKFIWS